MTILRHIPRVINPKLLFALASMVRALARAPPPPLPP